MISHVYLKLFPSRVFVYLKRVCTGNQPQTLRQNVRRPWSVKRSKSPVIACPFNFVIDCVIIFHWDLSLKILTFINLITLLWFVLHIVLICIRQGCANKWYRNTLKDLRLPNTVNQKDEKPYTARLDDTAIPHIKIKIYRLRKKLNRWYRNTATGAPNVSFRKIPVGKTIWDLEFSEHLL